MLVLSLPSPCLSASTGLSSQACWAAAVRHTPITACHREGALLCLSWDILVETNFLIGGVCSLLSSFKRLALAPSWEELSAENKEAVIARSLLIGQ